MSKSLKRYVPLPSWSCEADRVSPRSFRSTPEVPYRKGCHVHFPPLGKLPLSPLLVPPSAPPPGSVEETVVSDRSLLRPPLGSALNEATVYVLLRRVPSLVSIDRAHLFSPIPRFWECLPSLGTANIRLKMLSVYFSFFGKTSFFAYEFRGSPPDQ